MRLALLQDSACSQWTQQHCVSPRKYVFSSANTAKNSLLQGSNSFYRYCHEPPSRQPLSAENPRQGTFRSNQNQKLVRQPITRHFLKNPLTSAQCSLLWAEPLRCIREYFYQSSFSRLQKRFFSCHSTSYNYNAERPTLLDHFARSAVHSPPRQAFLCVLRANASKKSRLRPA